MEIGYPQPVDPATVGGPYPGAERLLGAYPQRQAGLFLQRIRVLGGRISWPQWRRVAELARRFSSQIHATTRQDIELHHIPGPDVQVLQRELTDVGLTTRAACGDTVRNVTVCPGCHLHPDAGGVFALAQLVYDGLAGQSFDLPRKFKISFSGCPLACAKPWLSDLGFVARHDGRFRVVGAGSLGPKPSLGVLLHDDLPGPDILPFCLAALRFFEQTGDRENRRHARFRHVREKLGDEPFEAQLAERFDCLRRDQAWPEVPATVSDRNTQLLWRLQLPNGNITSDDALQLAGAAEPQGAQLRINLEHGVELYGHEAFPLPDHLAVFADLPIVTACPGLSSCVQALADTWTVADAIRRRIAHLRRPNLRISLSGCPNSCAHSAVADIGLIGLRRSRAGQSSPCFRLLTGGHNAVDDRQASPGDILWPEDVPAVIERMISST